ncbi:MAG: TRAP transporter fused permease subunit [Alphaproteobacteria bacterium]|nr:TRAP transporter fused permease subunit [Alphaproteobacteria bacterium]
MEPRASRPAQAPPADLRSGGAAPDAGPLHLPPEAAPLDSETARKVEELIEQEEGALNRFRGPLAFIATAGALAMSLFHLWAAYDIVPTMQLRYAHVGFLLPLTFLLYPAHRRFRHRLMPWDVVLIGASLWCVYYLVSGGDELTDRASFLNFDPLDIPTGILLIVLVLEAARRTTGWIMPAISLAFLAYAVWGNHLPAPWTHRGYENDRLVGHLAMSLEGIFGTAVDVSSSIIILFTIYGSILQASGAGKFFIDFSFSAMGGRATAAGRTVVLSSFLLGGPSGSGVATTVTIGSVAWPLMKRVGYRPDDAGGLLAAGGLGAIISPPVLGAAAFLIAEFLKISYLDVIKMAAIPTLLYYASLLFMVELDQRKLGPGQDEQHAVEGVGTLLRRYGYHFTSLVAVILFMVIGYSPTLSVFYAMVVAVLLSFLRRETALGPVRLPAALKDGAIQMLNIAATCAVAGIIVGVVTLTGLGLKFSEIAIQYAGGSLLLTAVYTALIVWIIGLAVPVTASYIISAVIAAPALIKLGVPDYAAHMFIFYYAVLSEVSPPTALSPFAAAAITGAGPYATTLQAWKYTLPAFIVPFVFVTDPIGVGLLLEFKPGMGWGDVAWVSGLTALGLAAFAAGTQGMGWRLARGWERVGFLLSGLLLIFPLLLERAVEALTGFDLPAAHWIGMALGVGLTLWQRATRSAAAARPGPS